MKCQCVPKRTFIIAKELMKTIWAGAFQKECLPKLVSKYWGL
jgi:hypothetical protein